MTINCMYIDTPQKVHPKGTKNTIFSHTGCPGHKKIIKNLLIEMSKLFKIICPEFSWAPGIHWYLIEFRSRSSD